MADKNWADVDRYSYGEIEGYDDHKYYDIHRSQWGRYVSYEDYKALLDAKAPQQQADFSELFKIGNKIVKRKKKEATRIFEEKNEINYDYAIQKHREACDIARALYLIKENLGIDDDEL